MQRKELILTTVIAVAGLGIAIYFFRKERDKRLTNINVYTSPKGVASWEYTL